MHQVHYVTGAVFVEEVFDLSTRIGACSEIAGERTQCAQLCLQTAASSQLGLKSAHKVLVKSLDEYYLYCTSLKYHNT